MKNKINKYEFLENITTSYFDCYTQQIMSIASIFGKTYWKLFLNQKIFINNIKDFSNINDLVIKNNLIECLNMYYGVSLQEIKSNIFNEIYDNSNSMYLLYYSLCYYKPCKNISTTDPNDTHAILLLGVRKNKAIIFDNFYRLNYYEMSLDELVKGTQKFFRIIYDKKTDEPDERCLKVYLENISNRSFYNTYFQLKTLYKEDKVDINSSIFFLKLKDLYSHKMRESIILKECFNYFGKQYSVLSILMNKIAKDWYNIWCSLLKYQLQHNKISSEFFEKKFQDFEKNIYLEKEIIFEADPKNYKTSKFYKLEMIFLAKLNVNIFSDVHTHNYFNGITILELYNDIEKEFNIELNVSEIDNNSSVYCLLIDVYKQILLKTSIDKK